MNRWWVVEQEAKDKVAESKGNKIFRTEQRKRGLRSLHNNDVPLQKAEESNKPIYLHESFETDVIIIIAELLTNIARRAINYPSRPR